VLHDIYRFDGSILFVNAEKFIEELYRQTIHPLRLQSQTKTDVDGRVTNNVSLFGRHKTTICGNENEIGTFTTKDVNGTSNDMEQHFVSSNNEKIRNIDVEIKVIPEERIRTVVLDLTKASIIDAMGLNSLKKVWTAYRSVGIELVAAGCSKSVVEKLVAAGIAAGKSLRKDNCDGKITAMKLYPSVHDAVVASR
jgi:MFS superfamily sulfate permease-like transporter